VALLLVSYSNTESRADLSSKSRSESGIDRRHDPAAEDGLTDGLELQFTRPIGAKAARLVIDASLTPWARDVLWAAIKVHGFQVGSWYDALLSDSARSSRFQESIAGDVALRVSVSTLAGWTAQGEVPETDTGASRRMVVPLDLSWTIGSAIRVRLTETPGFWQIDRVAIDTSPESQILSQEVRPRPRRTRPAATSVVE
jgi:hypothetical protein